MSTETFDHHGDYRSDTRNRPGIAKSSAGFSPGQGFDAPDPRVARTKDAKAAAGTQSSAGSTLRQIACNPKELWKLARDAVTAWIDDYAPSMGAAISYYTVFSIAPLLLIVIAVAGLVFGHDAATGKIFAELQSFVGEEGATAIQGMVKSASAPGRGAVGTIVGVVVLLAGATTVFAELQSALDRIWRTPAAQKSEGIWNLLRARFLSFGLILAIGFLLLVSLMVSAGLSAVGSLWESYFGNWSILLQVVNFVVSLLIITALFALIYKYLPRATIGWHDVWIGAAVTALLFTVGKALIGLYIGKSGVASGFGAAGSIVVLLVWVYYSAQIFLLGAEFTWLYAYRFGSRRGEQPDAIGATGDGIPSQQSSPGKSKDKKEIGTAASGTPSLSSANAAHDWSRAAASARVGEKWLGAAKAAGWVAAAVGAGAGIEYAARRFGLIDVMGRQARRVARRLRHRRFGWHR